MDSLSSLSRELVDARRISSDLHGVNRPPSQRPGVSSHRQRFAAAAAGPSVSWRQPYAFAPGQPTSNSSGRSSRPRGDSPPHKRRSLPVENSSDDKHNPLQVSCCRTKERATRRIVALPPWRCYLTTLWASSQPPPSPWPGLPTGYQTKIRLIMAAIRLQVSCNRTNRRATRRIVSLPPWRCCLTTLWASFQPPPSPWPGLPIGYQTKIHLIMATIRLQVSCNRTKRRATRRIVALPPWCYCLTTLWASFQSPSSHWPSLPPDDSCLRGCGLCAGVLSEVFQYLLVWPCSIRLCIHSAAVWAEILWGEIVILDYALSLKGHEGVSFALPGMGTQSHLPTIRLNELQTIGYQICPEVGERCCGAGRTLRSALESYTFQLRTMTALFRFSGDSGQIPLELWPSWRQEEENLSSVTWCLPSRRFRSAICCQILSSSRRIYLRLPLLAQLDMPQGMCPYMKEHSLGLPRRLRHPGDALNLRLLLLRRSALKPPLLRSVLRPRRSRPIRRGGFRGVGVCPLFVVL